MLLKAIRFPMLQKEKKLRDFSFKLMSEKDMEFWPTLVWKQDGKTLWEFIKNLNPIILSSPVGESKGKVEWCKRHLGIDESQVILDKDKSQYSNYQNKVGILIDDMNKNVAPFIQKGGVGILHKSANDTIAKLKQIMKTDKPQ